MPNLVVPKSILAIFCILSCTLLSYAQIQKLDSLQSLLSQHSKEDTALVDLLIDVSDIIKSSNPDSAISLAQRAYNISVALNYKKGGAWSKNRLSGAYWMKAFYPEALRLSMEALVLFEELSDQKGIAQSYNSIANTYNMEGDNLKSLMYYDKSIKIYEKLGDLYNINRAHANIARTYYMQEDYDSAMKHLDIVLATYDNSESYDIMYAIVTNTKGDVFQKLKKYDESLGRYFEALKITENLGVPRVITYSTKGISEVYQKRGQLELSNQFAIRTYEISKELGYLENVKNSALILSENYSQRNNFMGSLNYFKAYTAAKDSMFNLEKKKELSKLEENFEISQKEREIELLKTQKKLQAQSNKNQRLVLYILGLVVFFIAIVLIIYIYNDKKQKKTNKKLAEQRDLLELQNLEILEKSDRLKEANDLKDKLFSIISHDLKSPFNSLLTLIENFKFLDLSKDEFVELKTDIYTYTKSLSIMLNNLLTWSKMKISGVEVEKENYDIGISTLSIITPFEMVAKQKDIVLNSDIDDKLMVHADKGQIEVVLRNIINNAIKFTREKGTILIKVKSRDDKFVLIALEDNGLGMSKEKINEVLSSNLVGSTIGTANEKGSGLGLLITNDLIASNDGEYWIQSEEGKGTTFSFTIPKSSD